MNVLGRIFLNSRKDGVFLFDVEELMFLIIKSLLACYDIRINVWRHNNELVFICKISQKFIIYKACNALR